MSRVRKAVVCARGGEMLREVSRVSEGLFSLERCKSIWVGVVRADCMEVRCNNKCKGLQVADQAIPDQFVSLTIVKLEWPRLCQGHVAGG